MSPGAWAALREIRFITSINVKSSRAGGGPDSVQESIMNKRFYVTSLYVLAICGMAGTLVGQSVLLGETKLETAPKQASQEPASFHDVVKNVLPAVVTIEATQKVSLNRTHGATPRGFPERPNPGRPKAGNPFQDFPGLPDELRKRFEEFGQQPFEPQESQPRHA